MVTVKYRGQEKQLRLTVVEGNGPTLLGRNWLKYVKLDWSQILHVGTTSKLDDLVNEFEEIFMDEQGTVNAFKATLALKEGATPKFFRARSVPFAIRDAVGEELDRLHGGCWHPGTGFTLRMGSTNCSSAEKGRKILCVRGLLLIQFSKQTNIHCLSLRSSSLNSQVVPSLPSLISPRLILKSNWMSLQWGMLPLTHYGVASAPAIFQKFMESIFHDIPEVAVFS